MAAQQCATAVQQQDLYKPAARLTPGDLHHPVVLPLRQQEVEQGAHQGRPATLARLQGEGRTMAK